MRSQWNINVMLVMLTICLRGQDGTLICHASYVDHLLAWSGWGSLTCHASYVDHVLARSGWGSLTCHASYVDRVLARLGWNINMSC